MATEQARIEGRVVVEVIGPDGKVKQRREASNLITDAGDEYYAKKMAAAISPANPSAPTAANGMKLGQGSTAAAKSGAGAALVTYISGTNASFDATYPQISEVGTNQGWDVVYKTTYGTGWSNADIEEVVLVNDQATDATSTAANSYARIVITQVNKGTNDTLAITWNHRFLGS